jgi:hypothetical protein
MVTIVVVVIAVLLVVVGSVVAYLALRPASTTTSQNRVVASPVRPQTETQATASAMNVTDSKPVIDGNTFRTDCYTFEIPDWVDKAILAKSPPGCRASYYPAGNQLSFELNHPVFDSNYEDVVALDAENQEGHGILTSKLTINGADVSVFNDDTGAIQGRTYVVRAPAGRFKYQFQSETVEYRSKKTTDINAFSLTAVYSSKDTSGAGMIERMMSSFKFTN